MLGLKAKNEGPHWSILVWARTLLCGIWRKQFRRKYEFGLYNESREIAEVKVSVLSFLD